jgi:hypothetical protein
VRRGSTARTRQDKSLDRRRHCGASRPVVALFMCRRASRRRERAAGAGRYHPLWQPVVTPRNPHSLRGVWWLPRFLRHRRSLRLSPHWRKARRTCALRHAGCATRRARLRAGPFFPFAPAMPPLVQGAAAAAAMVMIGRAAAAPRSPCARPRHGRSEARDRRRGGVVLVRSMVRGRHRVNSYI